MCTRTILKNSLSLLSSAVCLNTSVITLNFGKLDGPLNNFWFTSVFLVVPKWNFLWTRLVTLVDTGGTRTGYQKRPDIWQAGTRYPVHPQHFCFCTSDLVSLFLKHYGGTWMKTLVSLAIKKIQTSTCSCLMMSSTDAKPFSSSLNSTMFSDVSGSGQSR